MRTILITLVLCSTALCWLSCKHQKFTAENLPNKQIRWGNGGGFVGKESAHILIENGQIFSRDLTGKARAEGKVKAKKAKALIKTAQDLGIAKLEFAYPGNTYSFIEWQDGDAVSRIVWGDPKLPVNDGVKALFSSLNDLLKK